MAFKTNSFILDSPHKAQDENQPAQNVMLLEDRIMNREALQIKNIYQAHRRCIGALSENTGDPHYIRIACVKGSVGGSQYVVKNRGDETL